MNVTMATDVFVFLVFWLRRGDPVMDIGVVAMAFVFLGVNPILALFIGLGFSTLEAVLKDYPASEAK